MKKILFILMLMAVLACPAMGLIQHQVTIVDEFGRPVTTITSITVFNSGLGTSPTIFSDRAGDITVTNPITTSSDNSTFDQSVGFVRWFQQKPTYKLTITDGTKTLTVDSLNESDTKFAWYDNYIGTAASLSVDDNQSISVGTQSDWVLSWVNSTNILNWIPASDGTTFNIGSTTVEKQGNFNVFVGGIGGGGLTIDEGNATFVWTGGTASLNNSGSGITNIGNGSTGAVNIGSSTAGVIAIDTTSTGTFTTDGALTLTTTDAGADLSLNSPLGRVLMEAQEDVAEAILIVADGVNSTTLKIHADTGTSVTEGAEAVTILADEGGVGIRSTADLVNAVNITVDNGTTTTMRLFNDTGNASADRAASILLDSDLGAIQLNAEASTAATEKASAIQLTADAGAIELYSGLDATGAVKITADGGTDSDIDIFNDQGTSADSIHLLTDVGGITATASAGLIALNATGASAGDITITAGDDMTLAVTGSLTTGKILFQRYVTVYAGNASLTAVQSGTVLVTTAAGGTQIFQLPTAAVGLTYTMVDISATAGDDLSILPFSGDSVGASPADSYYTQTGDSIPSSVTIVAVNSASWAVVTQIGTWIRTDSGL